jgi:hypothetical protein
MQLGYGEAVKRVAAEAFHLNELARSGRQVIRGFYGRTERVLSSISLLCTYGAIYGAATAMLSLLLLLLAIYWRCRFVLGVSHRDRIPASVPRWRSGLQ